MDATKEIGWEGTNDSNERRVEENDKTNIFIHPTTSAVELSTQTGFARNGSPIRIAGFCLFLMSTSVMVAMYLYSKNRNRREQEHEKREKDEKSSSKHSEEIHKGTWA